MSRWVDYFRSRSDSPLTASEMQRQYEMYTVQREAAERQMRELMTYGTSVYRTGIDYDARLGKQDDCKGVKPDPNAAYKQKKAREE